MSDEALRELERAWQADPSDQALLQRLAQERGRSGLPAWTPAMRAKRVLPARRFQSSLPLRVRVRKENGATHTVGETPVPEGVELPPCRAWWVEPVGPPPLQNLRRELLEQEIPGLELDARELPLPQLHHLVADLGHLERLSLRAAVDASLLGRLSRFTQLLELKLEGEVPHDVELGEDGLRPLTRLERLVRLELDVRVARRAGPTNLMSILRGLIRARQPRPSLAFLGELPALRELRLSGELVDDDALTIVEGLPGLEELDLSGCDQVSPAALARVTHLVRLRALDLSHTQADDETLAGAGELGHLERLRLSGCPEVSRLSPLAGLPLRDLTLGCDLGRDDLEALGTLTRLRRLVLQSCQVKGQGLVHLAGLDELEELWLSGNALRGADLSHLPANLRTLSLSQTEVDDASLAGLAHLTRLERLHLSNCERIEGAGLAHLAPLRALTWLDLALSRVSSDEGLARLPESLEELRLDHVRGITGVGLGHLKNLTWLRLRACSGLSRAGVAAILRLPRLETLELQDAPVGAGQLRALEGHRTLFALHLPGTLVGDSDLGVLRNLAHLLLLNLDHCHAVSVEALTELRRARPDLEVQGVVGPLEDCPRCNPSPSVRY